MKKNAADIVLVTGASGFIGRAVVAGLAKRYTVVALDRAGPPNPPAMAESVDIDLTSDASVSAALQRVRAGYGGRIASVIHLAAYFDLEGTHEQAQATWRVAHIDGAAVTIAYL